MERETIDAITTYRQFKTESHKLANTLQIPDNDARHELIISLANRLSNFNDAQVQKAIANNDPTFSWKITYARRELLRKHYKQINNATKATNELAATVQDSYSIINMSSSTRTQEDVDLAITLLPQIFANRSTCAWVESVLRVGAEETQARYHQSRRQFNQKLNRVCKFTQSHRERTIGLMKSRNDETELKELKSLTQWANMMANEDVTDKKIQQYISQHGSLVASIVDTPKIKYQGKLVADWSNSDHADQYTFCNLMAARKERLEQYLTLR